MPVTGISLAVQILRAKPLVVALMQLCQSELVSTCEGRHSTTIICMIRTCCSSKASSKVLCRQSVGSWIAPSLMPLHPPTPPPIFQTVLEAWLVRQVALCAKAGPAPCLKGCCESNRVCFTSRGAKAFVPQLLGRSPASCQRTTEDGNDLRAKVVLRQPT